MRFINVCYEEFLKRKGKRKVIQFGVSSMWSYYLRTFPDISLEVIDNTVFIVDNDLSKQGKNFEINKRLLPVHNIGKIKEESNYVILITVSLAYQMNICSQLAELDLSENTECYSLSLMAYSFDEADNTCVEKYFNIHKDRVNKPQIHSFWFSGEEKTELYKRCMDSWHRFCPDFEITEWNADNYDITRNLYMREAFERGKWAFVSDYARLDVVYRYGGIYMDMDVELTAPIAFLLTADRFFCRQHDGYLELGSGFGAKAGDELVGEMLGTYENRRFVLENGELDKTSQPEWISNVLKKQGINNCHDSQMLGNTLILSNDYITCYTDEDSVKNAKIGIHWHNGGWLNEKDRIMIRASFDVKSELVKRYFNGIVSV